MELENMTAPELAALARRLQSELTVERAAKAQGAAADERAAFEAWSDSTWKYNLKPANQETADTYMEGETETAWMGWHARAALAPSIQALPVVATFDFHAHLARQAAFSLTAFGPGARTAGVCDHIRKELLEIADKPDDLSEWIDVAILALDGAWRCGGSPEQIIAAMVAKQTKNEGRVWPDWRTSDPNKAIEHDRSHDAPAAAQPEAKEAPAALSGDDHG